MVRAALYSGLLEGRLLSSYVHSTLRLPRLVTYKSAGGSGSHPSVISKDGGRESTRGEAGGKCQRKPIPIADGWFSLRTEPWFHSGTSGASLGVLVHPPLRTHSFTAFTITQ